MRVADPTPNSHTTGTQTALEQYYYAVFVSKIQVLHDSVYIFKFTKNKFHLIVTYLPKTPDCPIFEPSDKT